jgi:penicillin-binding protein
MCPGSSFKPVIGAVGVTLDKISPDENFGRSGSSWQKDAGWGKYFVTTLADYGDSAILKNALAYSDNIYFAKAALKIGGAELAGALTNIGFGERIPFEYNLATSSFSGSGKFDSEIQLADSGYGQGQVLVNPVHLASVYTAFVNGGSMITPRLIYKSGADAQGEVWKESVFTQYAVDSVREGLLLAIEKGSGRDARISGVKLAGKTGTAEIKKSKDDAEGTELGWFTLFTADRDFDKPLLIMSMVENVKGRGGSKYVVPKVTAAFSDWLGLSQRT